MSVISLSVVLFLVAMAAVLALTPAVRGLARRWGAMDRPDGHRKLHAEPIPKLGGVALFIGFYATIGVVLPMSQSATAAAAWELAVRLFGPSLLILLLGVVDDLRGVKPATKVAVQLVAGAWVCWYPDLRIEMLSNPFGTEFGSLGVLSIPLTLAWLVLITNAFNIVDGIDGLATGVAFVATACLFVAASLRPDNPYLPLLVAPLAGALIGFLRYNFNPASIFLGDAGSLWLGFLVGVFSVVGQYKSSTAIAVSAPLMFLALPVIETVLSMLRRFLRGQPIWQADASHIHHQLLRRGLPARRVVLLLYVGSGLFGAASLFLVGNDSSRSVGGIITVILVATAWLGLQQLGYSEFAEVQRAFKRGFLYQRRIMRNHITVGRLLEDLRLASSIDEAWPLLVEVAGSLHFSRVEVVAEAPRLLRPLSGSDCQGVPFPRWTDEAIFKLVPASAWSVISVQVRIAERPAARVDLWRSREEEFLHSELPALLDALADQLPRLLEPCLTEPL